MKQITLKVDGMTCGGCSSSIIRSINELKGVGSVSADHQSGQVVVSFDDVQISEDSIKEAIEDAGFDVL